MRGPHLRQPRGRLVVPRDGYVQPGVGGEGGVVHQHGSGGARLLHRPLWQQQLHHHAEACKARKNFDNEFGHVKFARTTSGLSTLQVVHNTLLL